MVGKLEFPFYRISFIKCYCFKMYFLERARVRINNYIYFQYIFLNANVSDLTKIDFYLYGIMKEITN